ncbi:hypothetical protein ACRQ1B_22785 [Rhizobium panacihumi]
MARSERESAIRRPLTAMLGASNLRVLAHDGGALAPERLCPVEV